MSAVILTLSIWALIATIFLIFAIQKVNLNEKRILEIDKYLKRRIKRETGLSVYKDVR